MKKHLIYIIIFIILSVILIQDVASAIKYESTMKKVNFSVFLSDIDEPTIELLADKENFKNISSLIIKDSLFTGNSTNLRVLSDAGYSYSLALDLSSKDTYYYKLLDEFITSNKISMIYLEEANEEFDISTFNKITDLAIQKGLTLGLLENKQQNGLLNQEMLLGSSSLYGISDRASFLNRSDYRNYTPKDLSFRLLRSVTDRGIRYLGIECHDKDSLLLCNEAFGILKSELNTKGYATSGNSVVLSNTNTIKSFFLTAAFSMLMLLLLLREFLFSMKKKGMITALYVLLLFFIFKFDYNTASVIISLLITIFVPVLSAIWTNRFQNNLNSILRLLLFNTILFVLYLISGGFIWSALSGFVFRVGFITYKLALLSYLFPFIIIFFIFNGVNISKARIKKAFSNSKTIAITLLTILILYIYLSRSGNYSLLPATAPELKLRLLLEDIVPARPRLKEIFVGYPCLFLLSALGKRKSGIFQLYLLSGSSITGISILNTFCHSYTPINISIIRAFSGFLLGTAVSLIIYLAAKPFNKTTLADEAL